MNREDVFPTFNTGSFADIRIAGYHLRLFAHSSEVGWASSVYSMHLRSWLSKSQLAETEEQAKGNAEELARQSLPGKHLIQWREAGIGVR
jgi:hypothetical protein